MKKVDPTKPSAASAPFEPPVKLAPSEVIPLGHHFAVQLHRGETQPRVAEAVLYTADKMKLSFRKLQTLDILSVGALHYVRMRTDLPEQGALIDRFLREGRAVISQMSGIYLARFPDGRIGRVPASSIQIAARMGQDKLYKGTKIKRWEQQFEAKPAG
jgi:hypothetical protein